MGNLSARTTRFTAKDADGASYSWFFRRDAKINSWVLGDYTGYVRVLERTWIDSIPRIHAILANHGMTAEVS